MGQFYEQAGSIFVDAYDAFYSSSAPQIAGDLAFYERVAHEVGGPVLELACGTGRIAVPLTHPETGRRYLGEILRTNFDHLNQVRRDLWRYVEIGPNGEVLAEDTREMALRWTYRWELHHLLSLCGLAVEAEYSDFVESAPAYGKELILVARVA